VTILLYALYYAVCVFLIVVVLLQHGKGADIGVSLGAGSSNTVFGARGAGNFLTKLTTGCAILFMMLAFGLARCSTDTSDLLGAPAPAGAPAAATPPAAEKPAEGEAKPPAPGETPEGFEAVEPPPAQPPAEPAKP
jgi:preprotein translocase subunit SecG